MFSSVAIGRITARGDTYKLRIDQSIVLRPFWLLRYKLERRARKSLTRILVVLCCFIGLTTFLFFSMLFGSNAAGAGSATNGYLVSPQKLFVFVAQSKIKYTHLEYI